MIISGGRINQYLAGRHKLSPIPGHQGHGRCKIASGAVSDQNDFLRFRSQETVIQKNFSGNRITIFKSRRERILRCQPIIDGDDHPSRLFRHIGTDSIIAVNTSSHPAAAMKKQEYPMMLTPRRHKNPHRNLMVAANNLVFPNPVKRRFFQPPAGYVFQTPFYLITFFNICF